MAEMLCEDLQAEMANDFECSLSSIEDIDPADMNGDDLYVLVISTFGSGELPSTAAPFHAKLEETKPDLSHVRFAIFGLGDMTFSSTFNFGSEIIMNTMLACNAKMIGERGLFNSSSTDMPEDIATPWVQQVVGQLAAA